MCSLPSSSALVRLAIENDELGVDAVGYGMVTRFHESVLRKLATESEESRGDARFSCLVSLNEMLVPTAWVILSPLTFDGCALPDTSSL